MAKVFFIIRQMQMLRSTFGTYSLRQNNDVKITATMSEGAHLEELALFAG